MKKNTYLLPLCCFFLLLTTKTWAQAPQGINYQTVIRGDKNAIVANQEVELSFEFILGTAQSTIVSYKEEHRTRTNAYGVASLVLGKGVSIEGKFEDIPWGNTNVYLRIAYNKIQLGTVQLMSVPYAMYALKAGEVNNPQSAVAWFVGTGLPSTSQGKSQDLYLNSASGDFFQKEQNVWMLKGSLRGPIGLKGDTGASGAKGDKGDTGTTGAAGPKGETGSTGPIGLKGDKGDTGATGAVGPKGETGPAGPIGLKGDKGDTGATGAVGPKGETGPAGPIGLKGDKGDTGVAGAVGPKGETGAPGPIGLKGDKGDTGVAGAVGPKGETGSTGATGLKGDKGDKGDTGATGPAGISILSGDVTGNASTSKVVALQNKPVSSAVPEEWHVLRYINGNWQPNLLNLSITGTTLSILGGNSVPLPSSSPFWNANRLQGRSVLDANPSNNQVLTWNGTQNRWEPRNAQTSGGGSGSFDFCGELKSPLTNKRVSIGECPQFDALLEVTSKSLANGINVDLNVTDVQIGEVKGLRVAAAGGSNANDGVIIFSKGNNKGTGMKIATISESGNPATGLKILSGGEENDLETIKEESLRFGTENIGIYAEAKDNDLPENPADDFAAILKGQVYIKGTKKNDQTSDYREFTIEHGFWGTDRRINPGYGLKLLNSGDKKNHWTFYCSNTLNDQENGGNLYFFNKEKLSVLFDQGGIMFYQGNTTNNSPWRIGFNDVNAKCAGNLGSNNDLLFSIGAQGNKSAKALIRSDGSYCSISDYRLKENFNILGSVLSNVLRLVPQTYNYKSQEANDNPKELSMGFIAQDVEQIFPDLVKKIPDEKLGEILTLNYSGFSVIAIKAIQEQQTIIEEQKTRLSAQEERLKNLESEMAQMKQMLLQSLQSHSTEKPSAAKTDKNN